ncbi:MAG: threonine--tRNA ligase [Candidatus Methanomethylicia archaeon]
MIYFYVKVDFMSIRKYLILTPDGRELDPFKVSLKEFNEDFRVIVRKEALKEEVGRGASKIHGYLKRFGFEWEENSDYGHMRFGPYATLIFDLVAEAARKAARDLDLPIVEVRGTAFFDLNVSAVSEHAKLYGDRLYIVESDKGKLVLRYAACHQQFSMIKDWHFSYRNLPFGALEIADSYRFEQSGEVELCFRLRRFFMPDLHVFTKDVREAMDWFMKIHRKIMEEASKVGRTYEILVNVVNPDEYILNKGLILDLAKDVGKPILVCIYPATGLNYYWTVNVEYMIVDIAKRPREIATVQIDIGNAKRFGIKYMGEDGLEHNPIILHTAILGSIERYIYMLFDTALKMEKPMLPFWISPVQVRVVPVDKRNLNYAIRVCDELSSHGFRVDIDDTDRSVSRKIVDAEREWIPYIVVVGDREEAEGTVNVRYRKTGEQYEISLNEFLSKLDSESMGYPKRIGYFPKFVSKKPGFITY